MRTQARSGSLLDKELRQAIELPILSKSLAISDKLKGCLQLAQLVKLLKIDNGGLPFIAGFLFSEMQNTLVEQLNSRHWFFFF